MLVLLKSDKTILFCPLPLLVNSSELQNFVASVSYMYVGEIVFLNQHQCCVCTLTDHNYK